MSKTLVLDTNILIRALLGEKVPNFLNRYVNSCDFKARDPNDWQVVALAMHFNCPIWTEDKDFFGIGIATWNSQNVEIYLGS